MDHFISITNHDFYWTSGFFIPIDFSNLANLGVGSGEFYFPPPSNYYKNESLPGIIGPKTMDDKIIINDKNYMNNSNYIGYTGWYSP